MNNGEQMLEIEISGWEKYNPRYRESKTTWLRLSNTIFEDGDFFGLSLEEKLVWFYLLCQVSKGQTGSIRVNISMAASLLQVTHKAVADAIERLNDIGYLNVKNKDDTRATQGRTTTNERDATNETNERTLSTTPRKRVASGTDKISRVSKSGEVWDALCQAYVGRYGVQPARSAKMNSQLCQFVDQVGVEDAPDIARFFLMHNDKFYIQRQHDAGLLARDAQALRTQWLTGRKVTGRDAADLERRQGNADAFKVLLDAESKK